MGNSLTQRSVNSVKWNSISTALQHGLNIVRLIILARLLPVEVFGIYAGAGATINLLMSATEFGLGSALLHRTPETEDEDQAAALHFTLKLLFVVVMDAVLLVAILLFSQEPDMRTALLAFLVTQTIMHLSNTPRAVLIRRVEHQRISLVRAIDIVLTLVVSIGLALGGATLWALLASNISTAVVYTVGFYIWKPVWKPRLIWHPAGMRYFLKFGSRNALANWLTKALDNIDDVWTGIFLGQQALGFYSRAYQLARFPSELLANPVSMVAGGVYAEIVDNRDSLSRVFFLTNAAMVRAGFMLAGLLALVAPELIVIVLGAKWLPALDAFRYMLLYALFEPMKRNIGLLYVAAGHPGTLVRLRTIQLAVMLIGLFVLGPPLGISGVALAVDLMLVVGIAMMLYYAQRYVDFSARAMFAVPSLGVIVALLCSVGLSYFTPDAALWLSAFGKITLFLTVYSVILLIGDRQLMTKLVMIGWNNLMGKTRAV